MGRSSPFLVACLAVLAAALATILAACSTFRATADDVAPDASVGSDATEGASDGSPANGDAATPEDAAPRDGGADAPTTLACDASFCDDFESGDLAAAELRWGKLEATVGTTAMVGTTTPPEPARRFFHVATAAMTETYVRLTHPIGAITAATTIDLRFALRMTSSNASEIIAFNIFDVNKQIAADLTIRTASDGTVKIAWSNGGGYTTSPPTAAINDAQWHAVVFHADAGGASLTIDKQTTVPVSGSPLAAYPACLFAAGAYLLTSGLPALVDLDDVQLDVR